MGKAIHYALDQWESLEVYLQDPLIEIDNNLVENAIRPTALGKKNWLFFGAANAGERAAVIYSIIESCRRHGVEPYSYLRDVLTRLPSMTNRQSNKLRAPKAGRLKKPTLRAKQPSQPKCCKCRNSNLRHLRLSPASSTLHRSRGKLPVLYVSLTLLSMRVQFVDSDQPHTQSAAVRFGGLGRRYVLVVFEDRPVGLLSHADGSGLFPEARPMLTVLSWEEIRLALMLDISSN